MSDIGQLKNKIHDALGDLVKATRYDEVSLGSERNVDHYRPHFAHEGDTSPYSMKFTFGVYDNHGPALATELADSLYREGVMYEKTDSFPLGPMGGGERVRYTTYRGNLPVSEDSLLLLERVRQKVIAEETSRASHALEGNPSALTKAFARMENLTKKPGAKTAETIARVISGDHTPPLAAGRAPRVNHG